MTIIKHIGQWIARSREAMQKLGKAKQPSPSTTAAQAKQTKPTQPQKERIPQKAKEEVDRMKGEMKEYGQKGESVEGHPPPSSGGNRPNSDYNPNTGPAPSFHERGNSKGIDM